MKLWWIFLTTVSGINAQPISFPTMSPSAILQTGCVNNSTPSAGCCSGHIEIASQITSIAESAFENCSLQSVILPASVTFIARSAFERCSQLSSITQLFNEGSTSPSLELGDYAFASCSNLNSITEFLSNNVAAIGDYTFTRSGLLQLYIPPTVLSIGERAFAGCTDLSSVSINAYDLLTNISTGLFEGCTSLVDVVLPYYDLLSIGDFAFADTNLSVVSIPNSVTNIGRGAFLRCRNLVLASIRNTDVRELRIGSSAFQSCSRYHPYTLYPLYPLYPHTPIQPFNK